MGTRAITAVSLTALLAVTVVAGATAADPAEPEAGGAPDRTVTGTVVMAETEDGRIIYLLDSGDGEPIELRYGPSWFSGELNPLHALVGSSITVGGNLRDGWPNANASDTAREHAVKTPALRILTLDGERRAKGKPPWAGGPKAVGEVHPGYAGWSNGQADKPEKPEQAGRPDKPGNGPKGPFEDE